MGGDFDCGMEMYPDLRDDILARLKRLGPELIWEEDYAKNLALRRSRSPPVPRIRPAGAPGTGNLLKQATLKAGRLCILSPANPYGAEHDRRNTRSLVAHPLGQRLPPGGLHRDDRDAQLCGHRPVHAPRGRRIIQGDGGGTQPPRQPLRGGARPAQYQV